MCVCVCVCVCVDRATTVYRSLGEMCTCTIIYMYTVMYSHGKSRPTPGNRLAFARLCSCLVLITAVFVCLCSGGEESVPAVHHRLSLPPQCGHGPVGVHHPEGLGRYIIIYVHGSIIMLPVRSYECGKKFGKNALL